ncbi:hypothetical protein Tco_0481348 [Tanacetum coccineum]
MHHDSPLLGGHTPGSDEGRMQQNELMDLVTKLSDRVLVLETDLKETKKVYSTAFTKLIMKVKKLEKIVKSNKARRRAKFIVSDDEEYLEDSSKQGRRIADIDQHSDISLVHHDADIQGRYKDISTAEFHISTAKPVSTAGATVTIAGVTTASVSTAEPSKGKMVELEKPSKKKDQVKTDEELAKRLEEEMQAKLEEEVKIEKLHKKKFLVETIAERKRFFAAQRAEQIRNKPPTRDQLRNKMVTYLKHMGKYTHNQLKIRSLEEIQKLYERENKWIKDIVPMDSEVVGSSVEKGTILMDPTQTGYKKVNDTTSLYGYDLLLWGDLKILFEPNEEDEIWKNQQDNNMISWRLFNSCRVHVLLMNIGITIHMMIEKKYPLTQEMLSRMLSRRLEVDHESEMAFELLMFTRSQLKE